MSPIFDGMLPPKMAAHPYAAINRLKMPFVAISTSTSEKRGLRMSLIFDGMLPMEMVA